MSNIKVTVSPDCKFSGVTTFRGWKAFMPAIAEAIGLKKNERITGFITDENGIQVYLETEPVTRNKKPATK